MVNLCRGYDEVRPDQSMQTVRLYDPAREPHGWRDIIHPTQFAAFASLGTSGATCDADGAPTSSDDAVCVIFDTLAEAEAFCRERVERMPDLRFEIRDATGHLNPPLFTIVHRSHAAAQDGSAEKIRANTRIATALIGRAHV